MAVNEVAAIPAAVAGESPVEYLVSGSFDEALVDLYRAHAKGLVEMLWVFVGDRGEAEDLCQEAFIRLQGAWRRIDLSRTAAFGRNQGAGFGGFGGEGGRRLRE